MPPNPKVKAAFTAMKDLGISEETVKPVLKKLLKLYDKNWKPIEDENYRVLLDAIFDGQESSKVIEEKRKSNFDEEEEEAQTSQLQRPLKRLRRRQDNNQPISSASDSIPRLEGGTPLLLLPKVEAEDQEPQPLQTERNRGKKALVVSGRVDQSQPGSDENQGAELRVRGKGKRPISSQIFAKEKRSRSQEIRIGSRTDLPNHLSLIIPKDEPFTDDVPLNEAPLSVIPPEPSNKRVSSVEKENVYGANGINASTPLLENGESRDAGIRASSSEKHDCNNIPAESAFNLEVASSPLGEVKLILSCNSSLGRSCFHMPSLDAVLKLMEEKSLQPCKTLDPSFSVTKLMTDICQCFMELGTGPTESRKNPRETVPVSGVLNNDGGDEEILRSTTSDHSDEHIQDCEEASNDEFAGNVSGNEAMQSDNAGVDNPDAVDAPRDTNECNELIDKMEPEHVLHYSVTGYASALSNNDEFAGNVSGNEAMQSDNARVDNPDAVDAPRDTKECNEIIDKMEPGHVLHDSVTCYASAVASNDEFAENVSGNEAMQSDNAGVDNPDAVDTPRDTNECNEIVDKMESEHVLHGSVSGYGSAVAGDEEDTCMLATEKITIDECANNADGKNCLRTETADSCYLIVPAHCELTPQDPPNDVTNGEETIGIAWVNEINDQSLTPFRYIPQNLVFCNAAVTFSLAQISDENSCSTCSGDCLSCSTPCGCACANGGKFAYTIKGLLREEFLEECISMAHEPEKRCHFFCKECPIQISSNEALELCKGHEKRNFIKECWIKCWCGKRCNNRVVQRGITCSLQVFMTPEGKGWGVRTLQDLPKGAFVCEFVGEILTHKEVQERNVRTINNAKHGWYQVFLDSSWDSVSPEDNEALCLYSACYGNISRFINHRCSDANLIGIPVEVEMSKHHYYHLAFFTTRKVQVLEELTWDYGIDFDYANPSLNSFKCACGSQFCRNLKRSNLQTFRKRRGKGSDRSNTKPSFGGRSIS